MEAAAGRSTQTASEWYACYTRGRHEKQVSRLLDERGFEVFLPLVSRVRRWHDREKVVEFPLFPSYVFARCRSHDLNRVTATPGLVSVVRFDGRPVVVPDREIANIKRLSAGLGANGPVPEVGPMLSEGQRVRITEGPLRDVEGVVARRPSNTRLVLVIGVTAINQGLRVELDREIVEPVYG
jgi:transcription antitermination factor NusG